MFVASDSGRDEFASDGQRDEVCVGRLGRYALVTIQSAVVYFEVLRGQTVTVGKGCSVD